MWRWAFAASLVVVWALPVGARADEETRTESTAAREAPDALSLASLMQRFSQMPGFEARFEEERQISLLERPLRSSGSLYFAPPNSLARHTRSPSRSTLVVDGDRMSVSDADGQRSIDLASQPLVRVFVDGFRLAIRGDLTALEKDFEVVFEAPASPRDAWSIQLTPRDATLRRVLRDVEIRGREAVVSSVRIREQNGDATRLAFSEIDPARSFGAEERERLFGSGPFLE